MLFALGVIVFALGLLASIALHELGHLVPAKKFGVKVTQYMVGFGPTILSRRRGETEYGFKAIPMGGYIRMIGMVPPAKAASRWPRRMAELVEDFRRTARDEVAPGDEDRQFYRLPVRKRIVIMMGGPLVNLALYVILMTLVLCAIGTQQLSNTLGAVSRCIVPATATAAADGSCPLDAPPSPAAAAGLRAGDDIVSIDGVRTDSWAATVAVIERSAGRTLSVVVERDGQEQTLSVTPVANTKYVDADGAETKTVGMIGASSTYEFVRMSPLEVPGELASQFVEGTKRLAGLPARVYELLGTVFNGDPRDPEGAVGVVGLGRLGGEVAATSQIETLEKVQFLLALLASLNLILFLFNMLPLLPLDGGHVAGALYEGARRAVARRRRRPDPGHVDTAQMLPVMYGVASVMIVVSLLILYADIVSPIKLFG
jgi:membrane-associated protease RseP (regulator of RpoE activity)